ncbi:hydantoinase/oxoprolinase family protein [Baekduia soli]|nr:hydantoinase/oxoprolinase family protein [Baekduia soli]
MRRLGVDVGGTFTDLILYDEAGERITVHKLASTPADPSVAILQGVQEVCALAGTEPSELSALLHGTTVGTNTILERRGAKVGMITTEGFRDILHIARHRKPYTFSLMQDIPQQVRPLILRQYRRCVPERMLVDGTVHMPLDEDAVTTQLRYLADEGIESVAICFLGSFANAEHEERVRSLAAQVLPDAFVSVSSDVSPQHREYERFSTAAINAYIGPRVGHYLDRLLEQLRDAGLRRDPHLMQSSGGITTFENGRRYPVNLVLSGPAAGLLGGIDAARRSGFANTITLDVGGTSADICVAPAGQARMKHLLDSSIDHYPVMVPMIDIETIGAGGGSIATVEEGQIIKVGPESAGADPGPAAYGRGGTAATVTDANVVLGRLRPGAFLGGRMPLDADCARRVMTDHVADPLGLSVEDAALGVIAVTVHNMVNAIETNSVRKGYDPREFVLVAAGGAGPLHAAQIARTIGIPHVVVPPHPGVTAAAGLLASDVRYEVAASAWQDLSRLEEADLEAVYRDLEVRVAEHMEDAGFAGGDVLLERAADCRYEGQGYELRVPVPSTAVDVGWATAARQAFEERHEREYFGRFAELAVHVITVRVTGTGGMPELHWPVLGGATSNDGPAPIAEVPVVFATDDGSQRVQTRIYARERLFAGDELSGPAIVEQPDSTTVIPPGASARIDEIGNIVLTIQEPAR